jgi:hypothetical protein
LDDINAKKEIYEKKLGIRLKPCGFTEITPASAAPNAGQPMKEAVQAPASKTVYSTASDNQWMSYVQKTVRFDEMVFMCRVTGSFQVKPE